VSVVAYLTHPLGERDAGQGMDYPDNVAGAMQWLKFLVMATQWAVVCPWFPYLVALDETFYGRRAFIDNLEVLCRSDVLVLCGGRMSPHMSQELRMAGNAGLIGKAIPVLDLLGLGAAPPWNRLDQARRDIAAKAAELGVADG
jgi:hypothetical protein